MKLALYKFVQAQKPILIKNLSTSFKPFSLSAANASSNSNYTLPHPTYTQEEVDSVAVTHRDPKTFVDKYAYYSVKLLRSLYDVFSGFVIGERTERKWLTRLLFLETVAGVPGMMGAMARHLKSLRRFARDYGWIHTLLEEAENERMHLMLFMQIRQPSMAFRIAVIITQGIFVNLFFITYLISPRYCHSFVGYLEEEAVRTYSKLLQDIDNGNMKDWQTKPAPEIARSYWGLKEDATLRDVVLVVRADEHHHREVNHTLAHLSATEPNPFPPGHNILKESTRLKDGNVEH